MGTNYYVHTRACENACEHCSRATRLHLGKSSGGWKFVDRASWLKLLDLGEISDEYGDRVERDNLLRLIEAKQDSALSHTVPGPHLGPYGAISSDFAADGYDFCPQDFS